jgi:hypothetical protein
MIAIMAMIVDITPGGSVSPVEVNHNRSRHGDSGSGAKSLNHSKKNDSLDRV